MESDFQSLKLKPIENTEFRDHLMAIKFSFCSVLGTIGNVLSGIVMTRRSMRSNTMALMLTVLAVAETGVLWVDMFRNYLNKIHGFDFRTFSNISCKLQR